MNVFDELGVIYFEIDNVYATGEISARAKGHSRKEQAFQRKRELNDHTYFLFMFSRLEDRIKILSDLLIDSKYATLTNWKYKRTWDILYKRKNDNPNSIHFLDRVALLTNMALADYSLIKRYCDQRNTIAHGGNFTIPINITTVITDLKRLSISL